MKSLFFAICAVVVTVTAIYHYFPQVAKTAFVLPLNGMGYSISWLLILAMGSLFLYWRMLSKRA